MDYMEETKKQEETTLIFDGVDEVFSLDEMPKLPKFKTRKERLRFISWCYRIVKKVNKGLI